MTQRPRMRWCKRCLEPDTRPDCLFDEDGICYPCRNKEREHEIDWAARQRELHQIVAWAKSRPEVEVSGYDCMIPVSGGKDSHRQAMYARDVLGLTPLLVSCSYPPEQITERGAHNLANLINLGFDAIVVSPAPETWRRLMRIGFMKYTNWCKPTELALYATAPKIAISYNIPLMIYGENPALSWGSAGGSLDGNANQLKYNNTMKGGDLSPYLDEEFRPKDMYWHRYPSDDDIKRAGLRMIYLGYYISDFNDMVNGHMALSWGLEPRHAPFEDTGQVTHFDALDDDWVIVNQMLKRLKFGFGRAAEQLSGFIREGYMTREEAVALAERLDGNCAQRYIDTFCDYLGITAAEFWEKAEGARNPDVWERDGDTWKLRVPMS